MLFVSLGEQRIKKFVAGHFYFMVLCTKFGVWVNFTHPVGGYGYQGDQLFLVGVKGT